MLNSFALTTVARTKEFMGITVNTYDTVLERLINSATDYIEKYCGGRRFKRTSYIQETYDGNNSTSLSLRNFPVNTSTTVELERRESTLNEDNWQVIEGQDYFLYANEGVITYPTGFQRLPKAYRMTYTAGYDYDNITTFLSDVGMADLEWSCWELVKNTFNQKNQSGNIQSESIGNYSVTFANILNRNSDIKEKLELYQKVQLF